MRERVAGLRNCEKLKSRVLATLACSVLAEIMRLKSRTLAKIDLFLRRNYHVLSVRTHQKSKTRSVNLRTTKLTSNLFRLMTAKTRSLKPHCSQVSTTGGQPLPRTFTSRSCLAFSFCDHPHKHVHKTWQQTT